VAEDKAISVMRLRELAEALKKTIDILWTPRVTECAHKSLLLSANHVASYLLELIEEAQENGLEI